MARRGRRGTRITRALVLRTALALPLLVVPLAFSTTGAAFTASTGDTGNSASTASLSPPSGLSVSQTCAASPITVRGASSASSTNGSLVLATPAGTAANDVLIAQVTNRYDGTYAIGSPAGWTLINRTTTGAGANSLTSAVFWRKASASEPASATFTLSGGSGVDMVGGVVAYTGVDGTTPVNVSAVATGSGATVTSPSVTTTVAGTRLVHLVTKLGEAQPVPATATQRWRLLSPSSGADQGASAADEAVAAAGATGTRSSTGSLSTGWIAQTGALKPALVPTASLTWTASASSWATGYKLERVVSGTVQATADVTPISTAATTDGPLTNGTAYTFRLSAYRGTWRSAQVTGALTPSC
jgi:hypothetical protein